ncbi:MAG: hypothetical protein ACK4GJ_05830 [bacterium]
MRGWIRALDEAIGIAKEFEMSEKVINELIEYYKILTDLIKRIDDVGALLTACSFHTASFLRKKELTDYELAGCSMKTFLKKKEEELYQLTYTILKIPYIALSSADDIICLNAKKLEEDLRTFLNRLTNESFMK